MNAENKTGHIHLRTSLKRKSAYARAAKPEKLADWMIRNLDQAAGFKEAESKEEDSTRVD